MKNNLSKDYLLDLGFLEYKPTRIDSPSVDACYQKLYRDELGNKKYYLNVKHYNLIHPTTHEDLSGYEISTQVYNKGNHNAINMNFLDDNIAEAENFIDALFKNNLIENYEDVGE